MAEASKTAVMAVTAQDLMAVITDYASYPQFVTGVARAQVIDDGKKSGVARVKYQVEIMGKVIDYELDHKKEGEHKLSWSLVSSSLMKDNSGSWELKPLDNGKTEVTYTVRLDLNFSVPGFVMKSLVASSLPGMMAAFEKRAKEKARV